MSQKDEPSISTEESCRATFDGSHDDRKLADKIEASHPKLACEAFSVSKISGGRIDDSETLLRVMISPRDIDETGFVHQTPFYKVFQEGLSVIRSTASRDDVRNIVIDGMYSKQDEPSRAVQGAFLANVGGELGIRSLTNEQGERLFGVYDQTVPRCKEEDAPVPTHAGVFLRWPPAGTGDRKNAQKDFAGKLRDLFLAQKVDCQTYHDGVFQEINNQAEAEAFVIKPDNDARN